MNNLSYNLHFRGMKLFKYGIVLNRNGRCGYNLQFNYKRMEESLWSMYYWWLVLYY